LVGPAHYRAVVLEAAANGTLSEDYRWLLGPDRTIPRVGGNDCLIPSMLIAPIESQVKTAISPRMPNVPPNIAGPIPARFQNEPFCVELAALILEKPGVSFIYYHRYLHGDRTFAGLLLAILPFGAAMQSMRLACFTLLAAVGLAALARRDRRDERLRSDGLLIIVGVFALFYGLPQFGQSFSFAPTDMTLFAFLLYASICPLGRLSETWFVIVVAALASTIAVFEFLTGGIPLAVALLVTLIVLDQPRDIRTLARRMVLAGLAFCTPIIVCFAVKLAAVGWVWGIGEVASFFSVLGERIGGEAVAPRVPVALADWLHARGLDVGLVDRSLGVRVLLVGIMLTYSAFVLGWGSHLLGGALVLLPLPYLVYRAVRAIRATPDWPMCREVQFLAIGLIPILWYLLFTSHTAIHSMYMVRPLVLNVALAAVVLILVPVPTRRDRPEAQHA
jgi:hypothetical protein